MINRNMYLSPGGYAGLAMSQIQEAATRIAVVDGGSDAYAADWTTYVPEWSAGTATARGFAGHLGTFCIAYADGHVKAKRPTSTATPVNEWGRGDLVSPDPSCSAFIAANAINCQNVDPSITPGMLALDQKYN